MSAALQICYSGFDTPFFELPPTVRTRMEAKIDDLGGGSKRSRITG